MNQIYFKVTSTESITSSVSPTEPTTPSISSTEPTSPPVSSTESTTSTVSSTELISTVTDSEPATASVSSVSPDDSVNVGLYYSGDDNSSNWVISQLKQFYVESPTTRAISIQEIIKTSFIPWGSTVYDANNNDQPFTCNGANECSINRIHACAIDQHLSEPEGPLHIAQFIICFFNRSDWNSDSFEAGNVCSNEVWFLDPWPQINVCATQNTQNNIDVYLKMRDKTLIAGPTYYPWVTLNDQHSTSAENDLLSSVCDQYPGIKPDGCTASTGPTTTPTPPPTGTSPDVTTGSSAVPTSSPSGTSSDTIPSSSPSTESTTTTTVTSTEPTTPTVFSPEPTTPSVSSTESTTLSVSSTQLTTYSVSYTEFTTPPITSTELISTVTASEPATASVSSVSPDDSVNVGLYYSGDDNSSNWVISQLKQFYVESPTTRAISIQEMIKTSFIPWGSTVYDANNTDQPFTCNGANECSTNRIHACAIDQHLSEPEGPLHIAQFIICFFNRSDWNSDSFEAGNVCSNEVWFLDPWPQINVCATQNTQNNIDVYLKMRDKTLIAGPTYYPWVTLNDQHSTSAESDLLSSVCDQYPGIKPDGCTASTSPTTTPTPPPTGTSPDTIPSSSPSTESTTITSVTSTEPTTPPVSSSEPTTPVTSSEPTTTPVSSTEPTTPSVFPTETTTPSVPSTQPTTPSVSPTETTTPSVPSTQPTTPSVSSTESTTPPITSTEPISTVTTSESVSTVTVSESATTSVTSVSPPPSSTTGNEGDGSGATLNIISGYCLLLLLSLLLFV